MSDENEKSLEETILEEAREQAEQEGELAVVGFEPAQVVMETVQAFFSTHPDFNDEIDLEFGDVSIGECPDCGGDTGGRFMLMKFEGTVYVVLCQPLPDPEKGSILVDGDDGGLSDELDETPHVH